MGFYDQQVLPRFINLVCATKTVRELRQRVCAGLHGRVVEVGFGSGLNIPHYPAEVTSVAAIEPADTGWKLAGRRVAGAPIPIDRTGLEGQALPLSDNSCDAALSTYTLCTIPDVAAALAELRRVLKPGAAFHFLDHGLAPDESVRRWQHRLDPLQQRLFGGCHLTRPIADLVSEAGFTISDLDIFYEKGAPKIWGAASLGVAVSP
ncbi:MAG TPA: methyltransferase domain-containing protein [Acidimicrobiia bacterium]|jgi:ubiquinone/menaquinone biosynthesis C-methylase UbiE|nr:methyltransferase domain-containing protein [Acidimicrobiia bacterium]